MKHLFDKIKSLKVKLLIQYSLIILLSVFLMIIMIVSLKDISRYADTRSHTQELTTNLFQMRKYEKEFIINDVVNEDFYLNKSSANIISFNHSLKRAESNLNFLVNSDVISSLKFVDSVNTINKKVTNYAIYFTQLVDKLHHKGFKNWGVEGRLREAIHAIEKGEIPFDKVKMLTLRRYEKDFLLRKDLEYVVKFDKEFASFLAGVFNKNKALYLNALSYKKQFHELVSEEKEIGLTSSEGLKLYLNNTFVEAELKVLNMNLSIKREVDELIFNSYLKLILLFVIQLVIALYLAFSFARITSNSIKIIDERITDLSNGTFPNEISVHGVDEIAHSSLSFNNLLKRIKIASDFAKKIGEGELNINYDEEYSNDVLGSSLKSMHNQLKLVSDENQKRNWINEGMANFVDLLRNTENLDLFYSTILSSLIKYIGANQGYLYVVNDGNIDDLFMEVKAVYAYGKQRYLEEKNEIRFKQGLVGQAWFDKDFLFFTEIPEEYVKITSGIGEATPRCIAIIPLISNENVVGAIEIASFNILESYKIDFVTKLSETLANSIASLKTNENTLKLLQQSQMLTVDLREQEEEIRQNMEEMNATQEEMERKEREMNRRMKELEIELYELKNRNQIITSN